MWAPGANHGANISKLDADDKAEATAEVLEWAGVAPASVQSDPDTAKPLAAYDAKLDRRIDVPERHPF